jgi:hypothetical protein
MEKEEVRRPLHQTTNRNDQANDLVVREPSAQVIILARGEPKHIGTLIEAADAADAANELCNVSPLPSSLPQRKSSDGRRKKKRWKLTVETKLSAPFLSAELSHHIAPPSPNSRTNCVFLATTAGES